MQWQGGLQGSGPMMWSRQPVQGTVTAGVKLVTPMGPPSLVPSSSSSGSSGDIYYFSRNAPFPTSTNLPGRAKEHYEEAIA